MAYPKLIITTATSVKVIYISFTVQYLFMNIFLSQIMFYWPEFCTLQAYFMNCFYWGKLPKVFRVTLQSTVEALQRGAKKLFTSEYFCSNGAENKEVKFTFLLVKLRFIFHSYRNQSIGLHFISIDWFHYMGNIDLIWQKKDTRKMPLNTPIF